MLLISYYQDKIADIINPHYKGDRLGAFKDLYNNVYEIRPPADKDLCYFASQNVRRGIRNALKRFNSSPAIEEFKEYLNHSDNFQD